MIGYAIVLVLGVLFCYHLLSHTKNSSLNSIIQSFEFAIPRCTDSIEDFGDLSDPIIFILEFISLSDILNPFRSSLPSLSFRSSVFLLNQHSLFKNY